MSVSYINICPVLSYVVICHMSYVICQSYVIYVVICVICHMRWVPYSRNPHAQLVMARYELFPNLCALNRMCPNCTMECPKTLLSCPQCKGRFVSSGIVNRSSPVEVILTKEELDRMVKEREEMKKAVNRSSPVEVILTKEELDRMVKEREEMKKAVNRSSPVEVLTKEELDRMVKEREESVKKASFPKDESYVCHMSSYVNVICQMSYVVISVICLSYVICHIICHMSYVYVICHMSLCHCHMSYVMSDVIVI